MKTNLSVLLAVLFAAHAIIGLAGCGGGGEEGDADVADAADTADGQEDAADGVDVPDDGADAADSADRTGDDGMAPQDGYDIDFEEGPFEPNPALAGLADNTAMDLGPTDLVGAADESYSADAVTDYSGFVYDPNDHKMLMFGGGHATTYTDTIYSFSFEALAWNGLYPSTPAADMICSNFDNDLGAWASGPEGPYPRPAARHTYDMLVAPLGHPLFLLLRAGDGGNEQVDTCSYYWGGSHFAVFDLGAGSWSFEAGFPWTGGFGSEAAEHDPESGMVVILGSAGLFLYDPATRTSSTALTDADMGSPDLGYGNHLTYYPPNTNMYYFDRIAQAVWEVTLDRGDFTRSAVTRMTTTGTYSNNQEPGFDYDSVSQIIGGGVTDSIFYVFDPPAAAWTSETIQGGSPGTQSFHALAYDPVDNVFIFITNDRHTWAYRYRN